ncbi:hypothetical protein pb186bvf_019743 [Paramecium bursaria]
MKCFKILQHLTPDTMTNNNALIIQESGTYQQNVTFNIPISDLLPNKVTKKLIDQIYIRGKQYKLNNSNLFINQQSIFLIQIIIRQLQHRERLIIIKQLPIFSQWQHNYQWCQLLIITNQDLIINFRIII